MARAGEVWTLQLYVACGALEMAHQWTAFVFVEGAWIERLLGRDISAQLLILCLRVG